MLMLRHPTLELLQEFRLAGMAQAFEEQTAMPDIAELSFDDRLSLLLEREKTEQEQRRYVRLKGLAKLRLDAAIESKCGQAICSQQELHSAEQITLLGVAHRCGGPCFTGTPPLSGLCQASDSFLPGPRPPDGGRGPDGRLTQVARDGHFVSTRKNAVVSQGRVRMTYRVAACTLVLQLAWQFGVTSLAPLSAEQDADTIVTLEILHTYGPNVGLTGIRDADFHGGVLAVLGAPGPAVSIFESGRQLSAWGDRGNGPSEFVNPGNIVWMDGNLLVRDFDLSKIVSFDATGQLLATKRLGGLVGGLYASGRDTVISRFTMAGGRTVSG